jgi:bifunctional DNA-binding transcriptional regulator/antitoxin component of YhaV-PrlF toxin-antitoxin module
LSQTEIKEIDERGRVVIPIDWRKGKLKGKKVVLKRSSDESIEILPYDKFDLTRYFDTIDVDLKSSLTDWHSLKKELSGKIS